MAMLSTDMVSSSRLGNKRQAGRCTALTLGKSMSVSATLFMKFVSRNCADGTMISMIRRSVNRRCVFQLPTSLAPRVAPSSISVSRDRPRHITMLPGGGSWARAK
jgi:hypothetical protein